MKKTFAFFSLMLWCTTSQSQTTPVTPVETMNAFTGATSIYAPFELYSPYSGVGPVVIHSAAQVDFTAGERIRLQPGFHAVNFNGNGYFHAQIGAVPDFDVVFIEPNESYPQVGQFEKLEIGLQLDAQLEQQIESFTQNSATGINPFDPNQISVEAEFVQGAQSYTVYGFYYEEYERVWWVMDPCNPPPNQYCLPAEWFDQNTSYHWRIRFAPPKTGEWKVNIRVYLGTPAVLLGEVSDVRFNCVSSNNPGFLEVGSDGWHLRHSGTHQSFFGIGQNLAWPDASQFRGDVDPNFAAQYRGGYLDILDWVTDLGANGGNMTRIVNVPWSYEYEWEELNNYSQRLNRAWELDHLFETAELADVKMVFCFEHGTFTDNGNAEEWLNWLNNPYNTQLANVDFPDDFLTFQSCRDLFKKKLRYFMSRWGYSTSLGIFQILSEMDRWTFRNHPALDPDAPDLKYNLSAQLNLLQWHNEMLNYVKEQVAYRKLLTSSSYGEAPRDYANDNAFYSPYVDVVCPKHLYSTYRNDNLIRFKEMNDGGFSPGVHSSQLFENKPALTDELGFHDNGADPNDMDYCTDVTFHNSIWATSFNGGLNSGLYWWQWFNNSHRSNFNALNSFFSNVDWETERFIEPDHWEDAMLAENVSIETFYLRSNLSGRRVMGWVHNASYYWGNILPGTCVDRNNQTTQIDNRTNDDPNISAPTELPDDTKFEIHRLTIFSDYSIDFYYTRGNSAYHSTQNDNTGLFGTLKPTWIPGEGDWAYKAYRSGAEFRTVEQSAIDTLGCAPYTVDASGRHELDSTGNFSYIWYFGDGSILSGNPVNYTYLISGTYNAKVIVSGPDDFMDTLEQTVVVLNCENGNSKVMQSSFVSNEITIVPNPTTNRFNFNSSDQEISLIEVYSLQGQLVLSQYIHSSEGSIDISDLACGVYSVYFLHEDNSVTIKKILKE